MSEEEIYEESNTNIPLAPEGPGHENHQNFEHSNLNETNFSENIQAPIQVNFKKINIINNNLST
jgi:hypothetical protein